jgi:hypothetical protein
MGPIITGGVTTTLDHVVDKSGQGWTVTNLPKLKKTLIYIQLLWGPAVLPDNRMFLSHFCIVLLAVYYIWKPGVFPVAVHHAI